MTGVILGNPDSVFVYRQAQFFMEHGVKVKILTYHKHPEKVNTLDSKIDYESIVEFINVDSHWLGKLKRIGKKIENRLAKVFNRDRENIVEHIIVALAIRKSIKKINPDFVYGHNLISYGIATCLAPNTIRKYIFPYGGDVFYIDNHPLRYRILRVFINRVTGIFPTAEYGKKMLVEKFGVDPTVVDVISLGVDLSRFQADKKVIDQAFILKYFDIKIDGEYDVVLNIRRFRPSWGSLEALEVAKRLVFLRNNVVCIFIGGSGADHEVMRESSKGLTPFEMQRIKFLDERVPEEIFNRVINSSTVFTSLLKVEDMRSSSILEGIAAGSVPVITKCQEYKYMEELGFHPIYVSLDIDEIVHEINLLLDNKIKMKQITENNRVYVTTHENSDEQMNLLLRKMTV